MSDNGDDHVIELHQKVGVAELMKRSAAKRGADTAGANPPTPAEDAESGAEALPSLDELAPLPKPGETYKAYARPANQRVPTLYLILGDGKKRGFRYSCLVEGPDLLPDPDPGKGVVIVLRFSASTIVDVLLPGRNLDELHNCLGDDRIRWVRELPKGKPVKDDGSPVVTGIKIIQAKGWPPGGGA